MKDEIIFHEILTKYALAKPLPKTALDHASMMQRKIYLRVLKKIGLYSSAYGLVIFAYYVFKKIGLGFTMLQSAVVATITAGAIAVGAGAGSYYAVTKVLIASKSNTAQVVLDAVSNILESTGDEKIKIEDVGKKMTADLHRIQFQGLAKTAANAEWVKRVTDIINEELQNAGIEVTSSGDTDLIMIGSVEKIRDTYQISLQLYEKNTKEILFASIEEAKTLDTLIIAGKKIAGDLARKIK